MQLLLGLIAGGTIFVGLLAGRWPARHPLLRSGLSMLAAGILIYLLVEILGEAAGQVATVWRQAAAGAATHSRAAGLSVLLVGGFFLGLVGLTWAQQRITSWLTRRAGLSRASTVSGGAPGHS